MPVYFITAATARIRSYWLRRADQVATLLLPHEFERVASCVPSVVRAVRISYVFRRSPRMASLEYTFEYSPTASLDLEDASRFAIAFECAQKRRSQTCLFDENWSKSETVSLTASTNISLISSFSDQGTETTDVSPRDFKTGVRWTGDEKLSRNLCQAFEAAKSGASDVGSMEHCHEGEEAKSPCGPARPCGAQRGAQQDRMQIGHDQSRKGAQRDDSRPKMRMTKLAKVSTRPRFGLGPCPARPPRMLEKALDKDHRVDAFPKAIHGEKINDGPMLPSVPQKNHVASLQCALDASAVGKSCCPPKVLGVSC